MDGTEKDTSRADPDPRTGSGVPRWVKVFVIVTAVLIAMLVAVMVFGGGQHGPGRHLSSGAAGDPSPPAGLATAWPSAGVASGAADAALPGSFR